MFPFKPVLYNFCKECGELNNTLTCICTPFILVRTVNKEGRETNIKRVTQIKHERNDKMVIIKSE